MSEIKMVTDIQIDLYGETQYFLASAKQGDKATRFLRVQLMNNGNEFEVPQDVKLIANIKKPDGKFCYNECENVENRVMVELTNQALAAAGTAYIDIEIRTPEGEMILSSAAFTLEIEPSMRDENAIVSCNEMTVLDRRIQSYIDMMLQTRQDVIDTEGAVKLAELARELAEKERAASEEIRKQSEGERVAAEEVRQEQLQKMREATAATEEATAAATDATGKAEELYRTEEVLEETLAHVKALYEQMRELKTGIAYTVDGGTPWSADIIACDGGTPYTAEEIDIDCGTPQQ